MDRYLLATGAEMVLPGGEPSGTATEPTLTVTARADGEVYTVSAGARSLAINNPDGATLLTTVRDSSGAVSVTGAATTTPSWTAPAGGATGEATQVHVTATDAATGLSSEVSFTERVAGTGGGSSWTESYHTDWSSVAAYDYAAAGDGPYTVDGVEQVFSGTAGSTTLETDGSTGLVADQTTFYRISSEITSRTVIVDGDVAVWVYATFRDVSLDADGSYVGVQMNETHSTPGAGTDGLMLFARRHGASDFGVRIARRTGGGWSDTTDITLQATTFTSARVGVLFSDGVATVYADIGAGHAKPSPGDLPPRGKIIWGDKTAVSSTAWIDALNLHKMVGNSTAGTLVHEGCDYVKGGS